MQRLRRINETGAFHVVRVLVVVGVLNVLQPSADGGARATKGVVEAPAHGREGGEENLVVWDKAEDAKAGESADDAA